MKFVTLSFISIVAVLISGCKKDKAPSGSALTTAKCTLKNETTGLPANEGNWEYTFDDKERPSVIKAYNSVGTLLTTSTMGELVVTHTTEVGKSTYVYDANIHNALPSKVNVSLTSNSGVEQRDVYTFFFFYDAKGRLSKISEQTTHTVGDYEYDLTITYNDKDNVTSLQYELTTGPRNPPTVITVAAYDDKPTPYAAIKSWKFLAARFAWDNYDPEPILTALSKNNPLDYSLGSGSSIWNRIMVYQYNGEGFPVERKNTTQSPNGSKSTFVQTFGYNCK